MPTAIDRVVDEALELPADARIGLVDRILASLNLPTRPEIDRMWAEEADRRVAEIDYGEVDLVPGEEVFAKIRPKRAQRDSASILGRTLNSMQPYGTTRIVSLVSGSSLPKTSRLPSGASPSTPTRGPQCHSTRGDAL
jgi:putative addiction module component (TIGR02574 family)